MKRSEVHLGVPVAMVKCPEATTYKIKAVSGSRVRLEDNLGKDKGFWDINYLMLATQEQLANTSK